MIERARAAGVTQMIVTGSSLASTREAIALGAEAAAGAAVRDGRSGIRTTPLSSRPKTAASYLNWPGSSEVVAVGECGLDYFRNSRHMRISSVPSTRNSELAAQRGQTRVPASARRARGFPAILRGHASQWRGVAHVLYRLLGRGTCSAYLALGLSRSASRAGSAMSAGARTWPRLMSQIPRTTPAAGNRRSVSAAARPATKTRRPPQRAGVSSPHRVPCGPRPG